ncbi:TetR/AcrR family transcriptional regulator C-terminal domain-containing protein [Streptomyces durbertensis]|uniref:TetR/AcrR family transcriptional regulator C-terminal domain-containing protein n=1 Tax=Streptomyces durbertensis TaxID=2448886 RepID=A0ABR6E9J2_9ACTN|nr:TetR/AcrR family transcriptional regulator C-terminal domain-containing protein [Streptomyces durbertensis]MBB1242011.1 TetR/AcrR family transcriptional regulator C-terminal domain-containing protein [Streptomyces durbertensis]
MAANRASQPRSSVWLTPRPPTRGRRGADSGSGAGSLDREKIVATAVRLLDAEGTAQCSMRRLAAELGVTPMSLYWYVNNKDDLMELALDAVAGEIALPDLEAGNDWRDDLRALAASWRHTMIGHPWAIRCYGEYLNIGPQSMRFSRCAQAVVARSPLPEEEHSTALSAVFQYVYGFTSMESRWQEYGRESGRSPDEFFEEVAGSVAQAPGIKATGGMIERHSGLTMQQMRDLDFDRTLDWLLAGMCVGRRS